MDVQNIKRKEGDKWYVYSKDGKKKLGGPYDTEKEANDRIAQVEHFKTKNQFVRVLFNLKPKLIRNDKMADKDYLVVPMVMLTEGVHEGSEGAYYYPADENKKRVELWNKKPVVVYHPDSPSACTPEFLNVRWIGDIMNATVDADGKVKAEAWLDEERVKKVDKRVWDAIQNGETLELSTGLMADSDEEPGEWNGEKYKGTLHNYGPDHLAVLPDQTGACSVADGAGFYRNESGKKVIIGRAWTRYFNELSQNTVRDQLQKAITKKGEYQWVEDVFDNYFIWSSDAGLYKQAYSIDGDNVKAEGLPEQVVRKFTYETVKNDSPKNVGNSQKENPNMDKKKIVDELIANKRFEEKHRDTLMGMPEDMLEHLSKPVQNAEPAKPPAAPVVPVVPAVQNTQPATPKPLELKDLPPEMQKMIANAQKLEKEQKDHYIGIILKHPKNTFTKEYLQTKDVEELVNLANIAMSPEQREEEIHNVRRFNYSGMADPVQIQNDDCSDVPVLEPPTYQNKEKDKKAAA